MSGRRHPRWCQMASFGLGALMAPTAQDTKMHSFGTLRVVKLGHHMADIQQLKWHLRRHPAL